MEHLARASSGLVTADIKLVTDPSGRDDRDAYALARHLREAVVRLSPCSSRNSRPCCCACVALAGLRVLRTSPRGADKNLVEAGRIMAGAAELAPLLLLFAVAVTILSPSLMACAHNLGRQPDIRHLPELLHHACTARVGGARTRLSGWRVIGIRQPEES